MCPELGESVKLETHNIYNTNELENLFDDHIKKAKDSDPYGSHMMILWSVINSIIWQEMKKM